MSRFAVQPNYREIDPQGAVVINNVETSLPAINKANIASGVCEKIFIQALSTNTESIFVGTTGVKTDGTLAMYELPAGSSVFLTNHDFAKWKLICASGGQKVLLTFLKGVY